MKVIFNDFQLESSCVGDVLKFYDGTSAVSSFLGSYCGTTHPEVIYSTGPYLYVKFHTDSFATSKGFSFSFSAVEEGTFTVYSLQLFNFLKPCECVCQSLILTPKHQKPTRCSYYSGVERRERVVKSLKLWQAQENWSSHVNSWLVFNPDLNRRHISPPLPPSSLFFSLFFFPFGDGRWGVGGGVHGCGAVEFDLMHSFLLICLVHIIHFHALESWVCLYKDSMATSFS